MGRRDVFFADQDLLSTMCGGIKLVVSHVFGDPSVSWWNMEEYNSKLVVYHWCADKPTIGVLISPSKI